MGEAALQVEAKVDVGRKLESGWSIGCYSVYRKQADDAIKSHVPCAGPRNLDFRGYLK